MVALIRDAHTGDDGLPEGACVVPLDARCGWDAVSRLDAATQALSSANIDGMSDGALGEELILLRRLTDQTDVEFSRRLRCFEARRGHVASGAASVMSWLRNACRLSTAAAAQYLDVARQLPELPLTEERVRQGTIGFHHATVIARSATEIGASAVRAVEPALVEAAQVLDPGRLRIVTRHLRHCADPDGALDDAVDDHARRWLHISPTIDGVFVLDGRLDAEGGAMLRTAINALDTPVPGDVRSAAQRRADALLELATRQLQGGALPSVAGQRPHLTVTLPEATLRREPGSPGGDLRWGGVAVAETVRRLGCDASVTRVTVGATGEPLDAGRAVRTIPPAMRRAIVARDGGCRFPGCDRPPEWTDGHHIRHWADGGATKLDNLVLLCRLHHRVVHEGRWRLQWAEGGRLVAQPP